MHKVNNGKGPRKQIQADQKFNLQNFSVIQLQERAIKAYQQNDTASEDRWNKMLAQSGTKKDKISAAGLLILENPEKSLKYFDLFVKWCFDRNHNFAISACQALANVFAEHVFTGKVGLRDFTDSIQSYIRQHKKKPEVTKAQLVTFYLQSQLKQYYSEFIKSLQVLLGGDLSHVKKSCIKILGNLAKFKELRRTILALIINKLGDSDMEVVNQVSKCLKDQFYQDILASQALMEQTQRFLFRANLPTKAQFFVINFLNSINLKFLNEKSLQKLFQIFYHFFTKCIASSTTNQPSENNNKKSKLSKSTAEELASRLFLNSIKGLNKVFSFMKGGSKQTKRVVQEKIQSVYKIVHETPNIKAKIQLLLFLFQAHVHLHGSISINNRFYRVLYQFITKEDIIHCSLLEMFFDLVLVCIKQDQNLSRVLAMIKRMLQLCFAAQSNFIITTLLMLDKIIQENEGLRIFMQKRENVMGGQQRNTKKQNNEIEEENIDKYDFEKRDPLFACAEKTCLWQLKAFSIHYHPTVRKFANNIINGEPIAYEGNNPLLEFNLTSFIQKFSLKKERKSQAWRLKVKRNLPKIRSSKYSSLLNKQLVDFKQDEQFIKKYLQKRGTIHTNSKRIQTKDIEQYADQVIQKEMDRLNPREMEEELSITPLEGEEAEFQEQLENEDEASWDQDQNMDEQQEQQFQNEEEKEPFDDEQAMENDEQGDENFDEDLGESEELDQENEQGQQQKEFQDVFDQIKDDDDSYQGRGSNKNKNRRFNGNKSWKKNKGIEKNRNNKKFGKQKHIKNSSKGGNKNKTKFKSNGKRK